MLRSYPKVHGGPWRGMCLDPRGKTDNQVLYAINFLNGQVFENRPGFDRFSAGPVGGVAWPEINGGIQLVLPRGNQYEYFPVVCADDTAAPDDGGKIYLIFDLVAGTSMHLNTADEQKIPTALDARYRWAVVHGILWGCNGYSPLFWVAPSESAPDPGNMFGLAKSVDGFDGAAFHDCYLTLPIPRMLGSFNGRLIMGNFQAGAGPYVTVKGSQIYTDIDGPVTAWLSEAITDVEGDLVFQVGEYFCFSEASGQELVGQLEFGDRNMFFCSGSTWFLNGQTKEEYYATPISKMTGCMSAGSIQEVPGGVIWLSQDGFVFYDGSSIKDISEDIRPILGEMLYSWSSNPYMLDKNRRWDGCSVVDRVNGRYLCSLPLAAGSKDRIVFCYDYKGKGWTVLGKGSYFKDGVATTDEKGFLPRVMWMHKEGDGTESLWFGDADGYVNTTNQRGTDAYEKFTAKAGCTASMIYLDTASDYTWLASEDHDNKYIGATLRVLDDRTAAEKNDGTWPAGRIPAGTEIEISDCRYNAPDYEFEIGSLPYAPQTGCEFAIFWPIRLRIIDVFHAEETQNKKALRNLWPTIKCEQNTELVVAYEGDPTKWNPDAPITSMQANRTVNMAPANQSGFVEYRVNCGPPGHKGRSHIVSYEVLTSSPVEFAAHRETFAVLGEK